MALEPLDTQELALLVQLAQGGKLLHYWDAASPSYYFNDSYCSEATVKHLEKAGLIDADRDTNPMWFKSQYKLTGAGRQLVRETIRTRLGGVELTEQQWAFLTQLGKEIWQHLTLLKLNDKPCYYLPSDWQPYLTDVVHSLEVRKLITVEGPSSSMDIRVRCALTEAGRHMLLARELEGPVGR